MASSEDVLIQVAHVKYKKDEGSLYVMSERLAWIQGNRDTVTLSHRYADIKSQKISPEGKPKIQLQIVLHDNATFTFQFINPGGEAARLYDRDQVLQYLKTLLPQFRRKLNREMEEKNRLLSENPTLFLLYKDLVTDGIISSEEFWNSHAKDFINKKKGQQHQDLGISSGFLSGLQPSTDGANGITYNLNMELLESIFKTYPAVKRKHAECVPSQMDETSFWTKFFQSHYFHRDRLPALKDLFSDCAKADDKEMKRNLESIRKTDSSLIKIMESNDNTDDCKPDEKGKGDVNAQGIYRNMIKRFNQHSIMILTSGERSETASSSSSAFTPEPKRNGKDPYPDQSNETVTDGAPPPKKALIEFEDLAEELKPQYDFINLRRSERYTSGPVVDFKGESATTEEVARTFQQIRDLSIRWGGKPQLLDSKLAVHLLGELSPGGSMMKNNFLSEGSTISLPPDINTELRNTYKSLTEILHHFWACFPTTTPALQEKLRKSHDTLKKFEQIRLQQLRERLARDHLSHGPLLNHITATLQAAYEKFNQWAARNRGR